ncbi:hypothetical protein J2046_006784 [Rhizobium petrolearium]|uniref:hypothetical protein n=1 Tax=Neorhizobium petrolearium TaxID=515361 RepID=UPI001AE3A124|nr:hypothetical protein [Neorhizobium petrolearium]MBP1848488.1 hypothetical protein [Neorhizobium petrolearium]
MHRASHLTVKENQDLKPGELIRMSFGGAAGVVLFLKHLDKGGGLFGVLQAAGLDHPMTWYTAGLDNQYLSYGLEWVIQEDHGPETACGLRYRAENARLYIDKKGLVMAFGSPRGSYRYEPLHYHLKDNIEVNLGREAAPIISWRIWESQAHRDAGSEPLFYYPASE